MSTFPLKFLGGSLTSGFRQRRLSWVKWSLQSATFLHNAPLMHSLPTELLLSCQVVPWEGSRMVKRKESAAHSDPSKKLKPAASTLRFTNKIRSIRLTFLTIENSNGSPVWTSVFGSFWVFASKVEWRISESFWCRDTIFCNLSISWDISYWNSKWSYHIRRFSKCFISWDFISSILSNIISSFVWAFDPSSVCKCSTCRIAELSRRDVWCWKYFDTARTSF